MADLEREVNRLTRDQKRPPRLNMLREFNTQGPRLMGPEGRGTMADEFWRNRDMSRAAAEADLDDRHAGYAKGGLVKKGSYNVPQMCKGGKVIKSWSK